MTKHQQLSLFKKDLRFFGGKTLHGKRKKARILSTKESIHIVLRSSWASGNHSFLLLKNKKEIERLIEHTARKYFIKVYRKAIVSNHFHLIIKISSRGNYRTFIRVLSSQIASHMMNLQSFKNFQKLLVKENPGDPPSGSTEPQGKGQAFWQFRPFTRLLYWGRDFRGCCGYLLKNHLEALGFIPYRPRKDLYSKWVAATLRIE